MCPKDNRPFILLFTLSFKCFSFNTPIFQVEILSSDSTFPTLVLDMDLKNEL